MRLDEFISLKELTDKSVLLEGANDSPDSLVIKEQKIAVQMKNHSSLLGFGVSIPCYFVCVVNCRHCGKSYRFRVNRKYQYKKDELWNIFSIHCRSSARFFHNNHLPSGCSKRDLDDFHCFFDYEKIYPNFLSQLPVIYPDLN